MARHFSIVSAISLALLAAGCETPQVRPLALATSAPITLIAPAPAAPPAVARADDRCAPLPALPGALAGRTITVERLSDIALHKGEVVLSFDDGPRPKTTRRVLDALDHAGVNATFLMVGQMAKAYPELVREVASRGHSIGSHTFDHANLRTMSRSAALAEIASGEKAVAGALTGSGHSMAPFFRFPYLADSPALRATLAARGTVVLDVDIDSRDYVKSPPATVLTRTMAALEARKSGIILFHDIHARTAAALPSFLAALSAEGYKVVRLVPAGTDCAAEAS